MKAPMYAYKIKIRELIDRRPSGTKGRLAKAMGTHRSFVSQIINPTNKTPIPAQHLNEIFEICHFSFHEKDSFLKLYYKAHPRTIEGTAPLPDEEGDGIFIEIPTFQSAEMRQMIAETIREFAERIILIANKQTSNQLEEYAYEKIDQQH